MEAPGRVRGAAAGLTLLISRTETGCQLIEASVVSTRASAVPQAPIGSWGISCLPVALISSTCGGMTANSGQMTPGWTRVDGCISTATRAARLSVDFSRVAVSHSPFPGICWKPVTHRSTATGWKNAVSFPCGASDGQPAQAVSPAMTGPPLTVGTGVALGPTPTPSDDADAEADADDDAVPTGWFGPPGLAATVPHPAASAPATSSGTETARVCRASRAIEVDRSDHVSASFLADTP